jgi:hypothetical protein
MVRLGLPHLAITDSTGKNTHSTCITFSINLMDAHCHFYYTLHILLKRTSVTRVIIGSLVGSVQANDILKANLAYTCIRANYVICTKKRTDKRTHKHTR